MKRKAYRKAGILPAKEFSRKQIAEFIREYRKNCKTIIRRFPDGSRTYQFDNKVAVKFPTNPYTIFVL